VKTSHHILPILYHHYGCITPSYASLFAVAKLAQPRRPSKDPVLPVLDIGSGNGYWSFLLRRFVAEMRGRGEKGVKEWKDLDVYAVDNGVSEYRFKWVRDTIPMDGVSFLRKGKLADGRPVDGGRGCVLLLVYPQATGGFTESVMRAYKGDTIVVAGTQNGNGFTGFRDRVVDEWVGKNMAEFELVLRMPLPSFAGKDEALFVFKRKGT
jgi:SAM-dependent methyltransferase